MMVVDNNVFLQLLSDPSASKRLREYLQQQDSTLLIPAPVLAEFLAHDFDQRHKFFMQSHSRSQIVPFDYKAALICGQMAYTLDNLKPMKPKQKIKVDLQIVAIAISLQAKAILTEDNGISAIVDALTLPLEIITLANIPGQMSLL